MFALGGDETDKKIHFLHGLKYKLSKPAASEREKTLELSFRNLYRRNGISKIPEIRFTNLPEINAHALVSYNAIIYSAALMDTDMSIDQLTAIGAHEMGHHLIKNAHFTKEIESTCDRLAVQLLGENDTYIAALKFAYKANAKINEKFWNNLREALEEKITTQEIFDTNWNKQKEQEKINDHVYGTFEERIATISAINPKDRLELKKYYRAHEFRRPGM